MTTLTRADIERMIEVAEKATPGPWWAEGIGTGVRHLERNCDFYFDGCPQDHNLPGRQAGDAGMRDGEFIAFARQFVPQIIAAYEELKKENERLRTGAGA